MQNPPSMVRDRYCIGHLLEMFIGIIPSLWKKVNCLELCTKLVKVAVKMKKHANIKKTFIRKNICYDCGIKIFPKVVMEMVEKLVAWCDRENPQSNEENMVIQYGAELLVENCFKIGLLIIMGFVLEKGYESIIFLSVFCGLRTQAGGFHAKTGWGCMLCMLVVWGIGIFGATMVEMSQIGVCVIFIIATCIIICEAPKTINRDCYTQEGINQKKINAIIILGFSTMISVLCYTKRSLIMCAVALEVITLLPENIFLLRRKQG